MPITGKPTQYFNILRLRGKSSYTAATSIKEQNDVYSALMRTSGADGEIFSKIF